MDSDGLVSLLGALPPEIISMIMSYLLLDDRKNVRLTCQMLYSCCNSRSIRNQEKFVFRLDDNPDNIVRILENPEPASVMNLEFQDMRTKYISPDVWTLCGSRVRSVEFYRCYLDDRTLRGMLRHCVDLTSIAIHNEWRRKSDRIVFNVINDFNAKKIIYPKLLNFVYVAYQALDVETVSKIFSAFPNIQQFRANFHFKEGMLEPSHVPSQLHSLTHNSQKWPDTYKNDEFFNTPILMPVERLRLTKYEEHIPFDLGDFSNARREAWLKFFNLQTHLQSVILTASFAPIPVIRQGSQLDKNILFHILRSCLQLRELIFQRNETIHMNINEVKEFLTLISKLRVLVLKNPFFIKNSELSSLPISLALDTLCMEFCYWQYRFLEYLFRHTRNMQHLKLVHLTDPLLEIIFNTMVKEPHLRTLILKGLYACTEKGFFCSDSDGNRHFFLSKMQELEYLGLLFGWLTKYEMVERIIREIKLPSLKHLRLWLRDDEIPLGALRIALSNTPSLISLDIGYVRQDSLEMIIDLCKGLKKLRYLTLRGPNLLEQCPSLRFVHKEQDCYVFAPNPTDELRWNKNKIYEFDFGLKDQWNSSDWFQQMTADDLEDI